MDPPMSQGGTEFTGGCRCGAVRFEQWPNRSRRGYAGAGIANILVPGAAR
jgi:hypothetical protein